MKAGEPEDDITKLLVMIRRGSGDTNAPEERNPADAKGLLEKTESTQMQPLLCGLAQRTRRGPAHARSDFCGIPAGRLRRHKGALLLSSIGSDPLNISGAEALSRFVSVGPRFGHQICSPLSNFNKVSPSLPRHSKRSFKLIEVLPAETITSRL